MLELIERYRDGLGHRMREVSDTIIAAEHDAVEAQPRLVAPSLVPSEAQQP